MRAVPKYKNVTFDLNITIKKELPEETPGQRLTKARIEKGWNIKELAKISGVSETSISKYERDLVVPTLMNFVKLSKALDKSIAYLSDFEQLPENTLGERIRKFRMLKRWTNNMLAKKANVNSSTISRIESGKSKWLYYKTIKEIEKALGRDLA